MKTAPYGSWPSPLSARDAATASVRLAELQIEGGSLYWSERRPAEGGRTVVVELPLDGGVPCDRLPAGFSARTRVHEYGGGAYCALDGFVFFATFPDGRVFRQRPGVAPEPLTLPADAAYADLVPDAERRRILAVREEYRAGEEPRAAIVAIDAEAATPSAARLLHEGADFYSSPRPSPDGAHLAWLSWSHPDMPWDASEVWRAPVLRDGSLGEALCVAGGRGESLSQPAWSPDGRLLFISDRRGYWNLYRSALAAETDPDPLALEEAEYAPPQWVCGLRNHVFAGRHTVVAAATRDGIWQLRRIDARSGAVTVLPSAQTYLHSLASAASGDSGASGDAVYLVGSGPLQTNAIFRLDVVKGTLVEVYRPSGPQLDSAVVSVGEPISFPGADGGEVHAFYYPPRNPGSRGPDGEHPPLLVKSHGGPTSASDNALDLPVQFWTSRGFALVDVNYRGSSGYGRAYRRALEGRWGILDVDDCVAAARHLAQLGLADPGRLVIRGGSAGGYTALAALAFRDAFAAGASYYGVADLEGLARDTHKFESRYLDRLIGPYPDARSVYLERSPLHAADRLSCPVIFFQGLEDKVVPPNQAETMVAALRAKGVPVAYVTFPNEGHGFRNADAQTRAMEAELYFYSRVFGFAPAAPIDPVPIDPLPIENAGALQS
ncbi:MAG TPA: S9 family peptidase [Thermoanaerobaculia bacterium]|nr:S9 family peptidase [Thermoanaerobaculia bacterium]